MVRVISFPDFARMARRVVRIITRRRQATVAGHHPRFTACEMARRALGTGDAVQLIAKPNPYLVVGGNDGGATISLWKCPASCPECGGALTTFEHKLAGGELGYVAGDLRRSKYLRCGLSQTEVIRVNSDVCYWKQSGHYPPAVIAICFLSRRYLLKVPRSPNA
jgi:hypothetical protein